MKHHLKLYVYTSILTNGHARESRKRKSQERITGFEFSGLRVDSIKKKKIISIEAST